MKMTISKKAVYMSAILLSGIFACKKPYVSTNEELPSTKDESEVSAATVTIPVKPASIPTSIKHLFFSDDYRVEVKATGTSTYKEVPVYKTDNYTPVNPNGGDRRNQTAASFANFSFSGGSVDVRITAIQTPISSYLIRPKAYNIGSVQPNTWQVTFTMNTNRKLSIDINGRNNPLFIFGNPPEPAAETSVGGTTYTYNPGTITDIGFRKEIKSNDRINIRAGAIIQGTFKLKKNATNVKFIGQGILTSGNIVYAADIPSVSNNSTFAGEYESWNGINNVTWNGLTIINAAGWVFSCAQGFDAATNTHFSHHNTFKDLKEINWNSQTDVMWFDGDYNTVSDCFFFANDDITTHGSYHCTLSNIVYWQGNNSGHLFMHYNYCNSDDITYDGIELIGNDRVAEIIKVWGNTPNTKSINNITFKNINIEERGPQGTNTWTRNWFINMYPNTSGGGYTASNWTFSNVKINQQYATEGELLPGKPVNNLKFINFYYGNTKMWSLSQAHITANSNVTGVTFQ